MIIVVIIVDRVITLRISCGTGQITLSSLQLVPVTRIDNKIFTGNEGGRSWHKRDGYVSFCGGRQ